MNLRKLLRNSFIHKHGNENDLSEDATTIRRKVNKLYSILEQNATNNPIINDKLIIKYLKNKPKLSQNITKYVEKEILGKQNKQFKHFFRNDTEWINNLVLACEYYCFSQRKMAKFQQLV